MASTNFSLTFLVFFLSFSWTFSLILSLRFYIQHKKVLTSMKHSLFSAPIKIFFETFPHFKYLFDSCLFAQLFTRLLAPSMRGVEEKNIRELVSDARQRSRRKLCQIAEKYFQNSRKFSSLGEKGENSLVRRGQRCDINWQPS